MQRCAYRAAWKKMEGDNKRYTASLPRGQVDGYWKTLNMSKAAWLAMPESQRVQVAWADMQAKMAAAEEATRRARESQGNQG
jgi:hypothetical protein